ncbi:MAG: hypothetical protein MI923_16285 [Phycisphaerales bacterium]|nr:hypothetical protein [Phycisphaerales bacterium]
MNKELKSNERLGLPFAAGNSNVDAADPLIIGSCSGDFVYYDAASGTIKSANTFPWTTDLATTLRAFAKKFYGMAIGAVAKDKDSREQTVAQRGQIHRVNVAAAQYDVGDMLAPAKQPGNALERDVLEATTDYEAAIYLVVKKTEANASEAQAVPVIRLGGDVSPQPANLSIAVAAEVGDNVDVTFQVQDAAGNSLGGVHSFEVIAAETAGGGVAAAAPDGGISAQTGATAAIITNLHLWVTTDANGTAILRVTQSGAGTFYLRALIGNKMYTSGVLTFTA